MRFTENETRISGTSAAHLKGGLSDFSKASLSGFFRNAAHAIDDACGRFVEKIERFQDKYEKQAQGAMLALLVVMAASLPGMVNDYAKNARFTDARIEQAQDGASAREAAGRMTAADQAKDSGKTEGRMRGARM